MKSEILEFGGLGELLNHNLGELGIVSLWSCANGLCTLPDDAKVKRPKIKTKSKGKASKNQRANVQRANVRRANVRRANIRRANVRRANFRRANFRRANFRRAKCLKGKWPKSEFPKVELPKSKHPKIKLPWAYFYTTHVVEWSINLSFPWESQSRREYLGSQISAWLSSIQVYNFFFRCLTQRNLVFRGLPNFSSMFFK